MKYVDKFVLVPIEKWEKINQITLSKEKKEEKTMNIQNPDQVIQNQTSQLIQTPQEKAIKMDSQIQTKKQNKLILNKKVANLQGKGITNLPDSQITSSVLEKVPNKYKNRVAAVLHYLRRSPDLKWTRKGTLYFKGKKINNSHVGELAYNAIAEEANNKKIPGDKIFYENIIGGGVPLFFIKNKFVLDIIYKSLQETDDNWRPPGKLVKKYKIKDKLNWDSIK